MSLRPQTELIGGGEVCGTKLILRVSFPRILGLGPEKVESLSFCGYYKMCISGAVSSHAFHD